MKSGSPKKRTASAATNVRESPSSFVGRESDLSAILLRFDEGARLVTILGPGGMGKTRAATRFARLHEEAFRAHGGGGAWFCDLTDATSVDAMCGVVIAALGATQPRSGEERTIVEDVGREIARRKRVLLVLDNLEQLESDAARVVHAWMLSAPDARFLATSRTVLGIPGENLVHLEPLAVPGPTPSAEEIRSTQGVDLFLRRAREVRPGFEPSPSELATLAEVVRATDGIPLAIELAAARVAVLTLEQLKRRLVAPLELLVRRDDSGKHGSMRRAIVASFAQLDATSRARLGASSVFRGGFTLEAAERVLIGPVDGVLPTIEALVARSLLRAREREGEIRFSSFEAIRELASEELASHPQARDEAVGRHARYYAELGGALAKEASTAGGAGARALISRELDNLVVAHASAVAETKRNPGGDGPALSLTIALALAPVLTSRGQLELCLTLLDLSIEAATSASIEPSGVAEALLARGITRRSVGDTGLAKADLTAALTRARDSGDAMLEAQARLRWGELVEALGETGAARAELILALRCLERAPRDRMQRAQEAALRARLGHTHRREGDLDAAERETMRAIELYREAGCDEELPTALYEAGVIAMFRRSYLEARTHFDEGIVLARAVASEPAEAILSSGLGILLQEQGRIDDSLALHARAVHLFRVVGTPVREASALYYLASAFLERGERLQATPLLSRAFEIMHASGWPRYEVLIAGCLAAASADARDLDSAMAWLEKATSAASACESEPAIRATLAIHEAHVALARASADDLRAIGDRVQVLAADQSNDDVRFALRLFTARARPEARVPTSALALFEEGARFKVPGGSSPIDLSRRIPLRRILFALATLRVASPGEPLSMDEIVRAGWPGERIGSDAAANRVRVALATLRKLGLRDAIITVQGGYLLDPATAVVIDSTSPRQS